MSKADLTLKSYAHTTLLLLCSLLIPPEMFGQYNLCPAMSCNDQVQISLDRNCDFVFNADVLLEGDTLQQKLDETGVYTLSISDLGISDFPLSGSGSASTGWNSENLFGSHTYKISNDCGNSCWGTVLIESKLPPSVINNPHKSWTFTCTEVHNILNNDDETDAWGLNPYLNTACQNLHYNTYFKDSYTELPDCNDNSTGMFMSMINGEILETDHYTSGAYTVVPLGGGAPQPFNTNHHWADYIHVTPDTENCGPFTIDVDSDLKYYVYDAKGNIDWIFVDLEIYIKTGNVLIPYDPAVGVAEDQYILVRAPNPNAYGTYKIKFTGTCDTDDVENNVITRKWYVGSSNHGSKMDLMIFEQKFYFESIDFDLITCAASGFEVPCDVSSEPDSIYKYFRHQDSDSAGIVNAYPHILTGKRKIGYVYEDSIVHKAIPIDTMVERVNINGDWVLLPVITKDIVEEVIKVKRKKEIPVIIAFPEGQHLCNILVGHDDVIIPVCGTGHYGSYKVLRTWNIIDWCEHTNEECTQIFEVKDQTAPKITGWKDYVTVGIQPWECYANIRIPHIESSDNCGPVYDYEMQVMDTLTGEQMVVKKYEKESEHSDYANQDDVWPEDAPRYHAEHLHTGAYWIYYYALDECGNRSHRKKTFLKVKDSTPPVAVCPDELVVSLIPDGGNYDGAIAKIYAEAFDDGSHDAGCGDVYFKVIRMDELEAANSSQFGLAIACEGPDAIRYKRDKHDYIVDSTEIVYFDDHVKFCCSDSSATVVLRVFDQDPGEGPIDLDHYHGNYNDCMINIKIKRQIPHINHCAPTQYIDCLDDIHNMDKMGRPEADYSCFDYSMLYHDAEFGDPSCGRGKIIRSWYYDSNLNGKIDDREPHMCDQELYLEGHLFNPTSIKWPKHFTGDIVPGVHITHDKEGYCIEESHEIPLGDPINCSDELELCKPEWDEVDCGLIGYNVDIDTLHVPNGSTCSKIIKRWTIIDWCNYDANTYHAGSNYNNEKYEAVKDGCDTEGCIAENDHGVYFRYTRVRNHYGQDSAKIAWDGYYTFEQVIKVVDDNDPVLDPDVTVEVDLEGSECAGSFTISKHAEDTGCISQLKWTVVILNDEKEEILEHTAVGTDFNWPVPSIIAGTYTVKYLVTDGCNNAVYGEDTYIAKDTRTPTPYCISGVSTAVMQEDGKVSIWASDFDLGAFDNCDDNHELRFTFSDVDPDEDSDYISDRRSSQISYDCDDLDGESVGFFELTVYVWDRADNKDYCTVGVRIDDTNIDCENINSQGDSSSEDDASDSAGNDSSESGTSAMIAGSVTNEAGEMIESVSVTLNSTLSEYPISISTSAGSYAFQNNPVSMNYVLSAEKDYDYVNGVSTLDLVMMQQHILALDLLDSPYKVIAADANNDEKVSASDILILRKLVLGLIDDLPANQSWRFIDANQNLIQKDRPWPFTEQIIVNSLFVNMVDQNFIGVKIGDVSGNASVNRLQKSETRSNDPFTLLADRQIIPAGKEIKVPIRSNKSEDVRGMQLAFQLENLEILSVESGAMLIDEDNYVIDDNEIRISWNGSQYSNKVSDLFYLIVKSNLDIELADALTLNNDKLHAEAYLGSALSLHDLALDFENDITEYALYQNSPNPFKDLTKINFSIPKSMEVSFRILDMTGKQLMSQTATYDAGLNEVIFNTNNLNQSGVLYYQIEASEFSKTMKMVVLD